MTIIAISDTHVGAPQANTEDLLWFLGDLSLRADEVTDLVLCGDILDFWRCDVMDMVFESADLMSRLIDLAKAESKHEHINFSTSLELFEDGRRWAFLHGWEFDKFMNPAYFDALCYTNTTHGDMIRKTFKSYLRFLAPVEAFLSAITGWRIKDEMTQMVASHDKQGLLENRAPIGDGLGRASTHAISQSR
jgi:UDP-2,3-diacylglucosamine pyrophosphatase LpxH